MAHRGIIQNSLEKSPGYVARAVEEEDGARYLVVNMSGDKVLFSEDLGQTYTAVNTVNAPFATNILNSNPSACSISDTGKVLTCNISRVGGHASFGSVSRAPFDTSTRFDDNGTIRKINDNSNAFFDGYNCFISADGNRRVFFADVRFTDADTKESVMLYHTGSGNWKVSHAWSGDRFFKVSASKDLRVMVNKYSISTDYGVTTTPLPASQYPIATVAVSGDGLTLYAVREKRNGINQLATAVVSMSDDMGQSWIDIFDLMPYFPDVNHYPTSDLAVNHTGSCVAVTYGKKFFGWSPNRGGSFYTETLSMDYAYNLISISKSGYKVCLTNTTLGEPTPYVTTTAHSKVYIMDMNSKTKMLPNINNGITKVTAKAQII